VSATFAGSTYNTSVTTTAALTVTKATPTPTVTSSNANVTYGTAVNFPATVPKAGSGSTPTGSITFAYAPTAISSAVTLDMMGKVTSTSVVIPAGRYTVTATYSGDTNYATASSVGVTPGTGGGLIAPQPGGAASVPNTSGATPQAQPTRHAEPTAPVGSGVQPKAAETPTATPDAQPARR